jgi:tryptophanyl-tRNA synthetase
VAHVEITREIARRFNFLFGREPDFEARAQKAMRKLGVGKSKIYLDLRRRYQEQGDATALEEGRKLLEGNPNLTVADSERLGGYLEGAGRIILPEPNVLLTPTPKVPGLDGQKMSKSYGNTIGLREHPDSISQKVKTMQTDPARVRRKDPGDPEKCPVWDMHKLYSDQDTLDWVASGCRTAAIGCLDCKRRVLDQVLAELEPIRKHGEELQNNLDYVRTVVADGNEAARDVARDTMDEVRAAVGLDY